MKIKTIFTITLLMITQYLISAPRITQVDNSRFALDTKIILYVNADKNKNLKKENFKIMEKVKTLSGDIWKEREITDFVMPGHVQSGINFLLLVDMSGSMAGRKFAAAKNALIRFISSAAPQDKFLVMTFGKTVQSSENFASAEKALVFINSLGEPVHNAPTPLYFSLTLAAQALEKINGRKALILLSDGVDDLRKDGYNDLSGFGNNPPDISLSDAVTSMKKKGVPVYSIGYECTTPALAQISLESGGEYFPETQASNLEWLYSRIRNSILSEYMLAFHTDIGGYDIRTVSVQINNVKSNEREYYAGSIFGQHHPLSYLLPFTFIAAFILLVILYHMRLTTRNPSTYINVLKGKASAKKILIHENPIIIGRNEKSDLSVFGDKEVDDRHVRILKNNNRYFIENISQKKPLFVNNKPVQREWLKDGSVIQVGNSILLFNEKELIENAK